MKTRLIKGSDRDLIIFHCPGCKTEHPFIINSKSRPNWNWNGDFEKPTFSPSLLCNPSMPEHRCHLFLTDGKIHYLDDCHHELKNQVVDLPELNEDWQ